MSQFSLCLADSLPLFCMIFFFILPFSLVSSLPASHSMLPLSLPLPPLLPSHQVLSEQMATSLTSVLDRVNSQWFRISQRLQWAAGSNPQLNSTIDEFERAMNKRKIILQVSPPGEVEREIELVINP